MLYMSMEKREASEATKPRHTQTPKTKYQQARDVMFFATNNSDLTLDLLIFIELYYSRWLFVYARRVAVDTHKSVPTT